MRLSTAVFVQVEELLGCIDQIWLKRSCVSQIRVKNETCS